MLQYIKNKRVLFITTKNPDYIRNTQEIAFLEEHASFYTVIASTHTSYPKRLLSIYRRLLTVPMNEYDTVFLGFAPQLVLPLFGNSKTWTLSKTSLSPCMTLYAATDASSVLTVT